MARGSGSAKHHTLGYEGSKYGEEIYRPAHHRPPSRRFRNVTHPWTRLQHEAKKHFDVTAFRSSQRAILQSVLEGRNTLSIMPTGAGKSLTYQLAALVLPKPHTRGSEKACAGCGRRHAPGPLREGRQQEAKADYLQKA